MGSRVIIHSRTGLRLADFDGLGEWGAKQKLTEVVKMLRTFLARLDMA